MLLSNALCTAEYFSGCKYIKCISFYFKYFLHNTKKTLQEHFYTLTNVITVSTKIARPLQIELIKVLSMSTVIIWNALKSFIKSLLKEEKYLELNIEMQTAFCFPTKLFLKDAYIIYSAKVYSKQ